jgi:hypothetical protein
MEHVEVPARTQLLPRSEVASDGEVTKHYRRQLHERHATGVPLQFAISRLIPRRTSQLTNSHFALSCRAVLTDANIYPGGKPQNSSAENIPRFYSTSRTPSGLLPDGEVRIPGPRAKLHHGRRCPFYRLRRSQRNQRYADDNQHSRCDQKSCALTRNFESQYRHNQGVREA